jgi:hypothetical protein
MPDKEKRIARPQAKDEGDELPSKDQSIAEQKSLLDDFLSRPTEQLIPWESIKLPSEGVYYGGAVPNGTVEVRAWGIQTDKILATPRLAQTGKSFDYILKSCVRLPNDFDHLNLLVGDRIFMLYYLRGITYGNMYEFLVECSKEECGKTWTESYDMNTLRSTIIKPNPDIGLEPFKVVLPFVSEQLKQEFWVSIRLLRGYDLNAMMNQKQIKRTLRPTARVRSRTTRMPQVEELQTLDKTIEENLRMVMVDAMGDKSPDKIEKFVERMHAKDTATIREFLKENSPGIDTSIEVTCPDCGNTMTMDLPITESFFRPTESGKSRE